MKDFFNNVHSRKRLPKTFADWPPISISAGKSKNAEELMEMHCKPLLELNKFLHKGYRINSTILWGFRIAALLNIADHIIEAVDQKKITLLILLYSDQFTLILAVLTFRSLKNFSQSEKLKIPKRDILHCGFCTCICPTFTTFTILVLLEHRKFISRFDVYNTNIMSKKLTSQWDNSLHFWTLFSVFNIETL